MERGAGVVLLAADPRVGDRHPKVLRPDPYHRPLVVRRQRLDTYSSTKNTTSKSPDRADRKHEGRGA